MNRTNVLTSQLSQAQTSEVRIYVAHSPFTSPETDVSFVVSVVVDPFKCSEMVDATVLAS